MIKEKDVSMRVFQRKVVIDDRTQDYIEKRVQKVGKLLEKFSKEDYELEISRDKKGKFLVEMMIRTPYQMYRKEELSESIEGAVDVVVDNIKNQIVKDKEKLRGLRERGARSIKKKVVVDSEARFRKVQ